jgi:hypothetical protein
MKVKIICLSSLFLLAACGSDNSDSKTTSSSKSSESPNITNSVSSSKLTKFMSEDKICGILAIEDIQKLFNTSTLIETSASSFRSNSSCSYSWERSDKAERQKKFMEDARNAAMGTGKRLSMREKVMDYSFTITLSESKQKKEHFVPRKLTEEQLQVQIDTARKAAEKRLTKKQKEIAGDAATSMIEGMLRKSNQNQEVNGVGDAAYWSVIGQGNLNVLIGNVKIVIAPMIADTEEADIEIAKKVALKLLK